ncbi:MAG: peptidylprolyl isomerase [bacterium]
MKIFYLMSILFITGNVFAQEVVDKIVAIVDEEVILKSELDFRVAYAAAEKKLNPADPLLIKQVLDFMIEDKLLYAQAELDSIEVKDDEVEQQINYQLNYFITQYGSQEKLEEMYGMSTEKIKRTLRDDIRKNLMTQKLRADKFGDVDISRREVEDFYNTYKDSLGLIPEKFQLAHIFINPQASEKVKDNAKKFTQSLLDSIKNGADFAELAKKFSEDPGSAAQGGDLGFVKRGVFYPEFESVAFNLSQGETSGVVESPVGFHIIQMIERRGESIHSRHILVKPKKDDEADLNAIEFLQELRDSVMKNVNSFEYYASKYSDDKETAKFGGDLGLLEIQQLDKSLREQVYKLKEGEISFPKRLDVDKTVYGYHIVRLLKHTVEHKANLDMDYEDIRKIAEYEKRERLYTKWVAELKQRIFWEIKL